MDKSKAIVITPEMIAAGEAVLDRACDSAEINPSWILISAAEEVYIAMTLAKENRSRGKK